MGDCALVVAALVTAWLLPAALEDYRTMRVSLKWTLPLFAVAFPAGLILGNFPFVIAMLMSFLIAYRLDLAHGADGKVAVGLAGICPLLLMAGLGVTACTFLILRLRRRDFALRVRGSRDSVHVPAVTCLYAGCALITFVMALLPEPGIVL